MSVKKVQLSIISLFSLLVIFPYAVNSQITVNINSGNPALPFPQFLAYTHSTGQFENLATHTPDGVPHAEMEQTIRDAYQIMMNRCVKPGGGVGGKDYIQFRSNPQTSEGDGYGLLGAASMADKETFDGLWLYIHDYTMANVKRYSDCKEPSPGYAYSRLPGWNGAGFNSAADGDVDIGLALLTAYLQWGEFMGIDDACGEPISYKREVVEFLKALTDTMVNGLGQNYLSGDIGLDGYIKGGDNWTELTDWANDKTRSGLPRIPDAKGPNQQHIDYAAPSYFHAFAEFLTKENPVLYAWNIKQFQRAEASSDWLIGQMLTNEKMIPFAGWVELPSTNVPTFTNFSDGQDFRLAWRTIINTMWHGNPSSSWDPVSHQVISGIPNSYEQDLGKRYARFLWDSRQSPWNNPCVQNVGSKDFFWGPEVLKYYYTPEGKPIGSLALNWVPGTGSPSAVVAQNFNLMAELYRSLEIKWDSENEERYLKSIPHYFHEWFRLMGMLTLTGNYPAPSSIGPTANMKVYVDVDKTAAVKDEEVTYKVSYRNYGSLDAQNVIIIDTIDKDFFYVSSTGGGVFNATTSTVTWNIGTVPGFKSSTGITPTTGEMILKVSLTNPTKKLCGNKAVVTCSNGTGWTSNEYPNVLSAIMKRNFVNSINQPLIDSISEISTLHGGRPGVHFTYHSDTSAVDTSHSIAVRLFHDAQEAYIDHGSYRVSYFLYDTINRGISGQNGATNGWNVTTDIKEGVDAIKISHENLLPGSDSHGKWNQRIIIQFSDSLPTDTKPRSLTTTDYHLNWYRGVPSMIHRGGIDPLRIVFRINTSNYNKIKWDDDWSWSSEAYDTDAGSGYPITPDFTDPNPDDKGIAVDRVYPKQCDIAAKTIDNILVEEWDGYTWRQIFGNYPLQPVKALNLATNKTKQISILQINNSVIKYSQSSTGPVRIQVIDLQGRVVTTLVDIYQKAGKYTVRWNHREYGSNMYFLRMVSANASLVKKFSLVKP